MENKNALPIGTLIILIIILTIIFKSDKWSGYFYPNKDDLTHWVESPVIFKSLEECRDWAQNKGADLNIDPMQYDYECGLNCEYKNGFNICKETLN